MRRLSTRRLRETFLEALPGHLVEPFKHDWPVWARRAQQPFLADWRTWLVLGGRGAGKTRMGAEWIRGVAMADPHQPGDAAGRIALIGQTYSDVRDVMVEGESGLLRVHSRTDRPAWRVSRRELQWPNGAIAQLFSASDPDSLRGNQFGAAWCDAKTIWGAILSIGAAMAGTVGLEIDAATQAELVDTLVHLTGALGALIAIYGRLTATEIIS